MTTTTRCSECDGRNGDHEFNCAFYHPDTTPLPVPSRWRARTSAGRMIPFTLAPAVTEAFARRYADTTLPGTLNLQTETIIDIEREG